MKRILKLAFVFIALDVLAFSSFGQVIDLDVNGIRIQASYKSIVKKLGKPISDRLAGNVPCGGPMRTLKYDGLTLRLEAGDENPFGLWKVEVTSPRWLVSGAKIGNTERKIIQKFGRGNKTDGNVKPFISYWIDDGWANFYFKKNRLKKVEWEFNFC